MLDGTETNKVLVVKVQPVDRNNRTPNISKLNVEIEYRHKCEWTTIIIYSVMSNRALFPRVSRVFSSARDPADRVLIDDCVTAKFYGYTIQILIGRFVFSTSASFVALYWGIAHVLFSFPSFYIGLQITSKSKRSPNVSRNAHGAGPLYAPGRQIAASASPGRRSPPKRDCGQQQSLLVLSSPSFSFAFAVFPDSLQFARRCSHMNGVRCPPFIVCEVWDAPLHGKRGNDEAVLLPSL